MNKKKSNYLLAALFTLASCGDFLEQIPRYNLTLENAVADYNGARNVLNGMYSVIGDQTSLGGSVACRLSSQGGFFQYYATEYSAAFLENHGYSLWIAYYALVNAANAAIEAIGQLPDNKFPAPGRKEEMIAEARCTRAWANAHLLWVFGHWWAGDESPYGLLYRDKMANLGNLQKERLTVGESYQKLFEDLDVAIAHAPPFTSPRYLSREMARVLKAKLLLFRGTTRDNVQDLEDALELVLHVKENAPAAWCMEKDIVKMYAAGWETKEVLWTRYQGDMSRVSAYEYDYAYLLGYQSLFHAIPLAWLKADNRYPLVTGEARAPEAWDTSRRPAVVKLYHGGNHETPDAPYTAYYFRRAELYLMEAELKARLDRFTVPGALAPLNEMRACRENPSLPPLAATTKSELLRLIFQEIWTEQFLENGSEFFAAIRFINDTDASPARGKPWIYTLKQDVNFSENHYCWPIPGFELQKNLKMKPNPGYDQ